MKKALIISSAILMLSSFTLGVEQGSKVYICTGGSSKCYHSRPNCNGLRNCGGEIKEISLEKAQQMGRRACKTCCPQ